MIKQLLKLSQEIRDYFNVLFRWMKNKRNPVFKHKENSLFIFMYGSLGSGKSTIAASLCYAIELNPDTRLLYNFNEPDGITFLRKNWINNLKEHSFPERSNIFEISEVDIGIESKESASLPITFIELSGEKFHSIDPTKGNSAFTGKIDSNIYKYIAKSKVHFIIADTTKNEKDNTSISIYIQYLEAILSDKKIEDYKFCLILSKWDKVEHLGLTAREYVRKYLPSIYTLIMLNSTISISRVFTFSIGKVEQKDNSRTERISNFNYNDAKKILKWLWMNHDV